MRTRFRGLHPVYQNFDKWVSVYVFTVCEYPVSPFSAEEVVRNERCLKVGDRDGGSDHDRDLKPDTSLHMPDDPETYLAVLKAAYDYEPQPDAEDELTIKEHQILFLIERVDDELSTPLGTFIPQSPPDLHSFSAVGGGSSRNRKMKPLLVWSPQRTWNKYGPSQLWHSVHHRLSFRLTARAYISRQGTLRLRRCEPGRTIRQGG